MNFIIKEVKILKILFIGEYPPIASNLSTQGYWTVQTLLAAGHQVYVVSDGWHLKKEYRYAISPHELELVNNNYRYYSLDPIQKSRTQLGDEVIIPRLVSLALDVYERFSFDFIYSNSLERYAPAAYILKGLVKKPVIVSHFNANLGLIIHDPYLESFFQQMIRSFELVVAGPGQRSIYQEFGVTNIVEDILINRDFNFNSNSFNLKFPDDYPIIALTGQMKTKQKCRYIVNQLEQINGQFYLVLAFCGYAALTLRKLLYDSKLKDRIIDLGALPPWYEMEVIKKSDLTFTVGNWTVEPGYFNTLEIGKIMAGGKPPLIFPCLPASCFMTTPDNSIIINNNDLVDSITKLLSNPVVIKEKGDNAKLSYASLNNKTLNDIFEEVIYHG